MTENEPLSRILALFPGAGLGATELFECAKRFQVNALVDSSGAETKDGVSNRAEIIDFRDVTALSDACAKNMPASGVLVWPSARVTNTGGAPGTLRDMMTRCFCAIKAVTLPFMRQRRGCIWIISPTVSAPDSGVPSLTAHMAACRAGISMLSATAGLEIAKKGVAVNFVDLRFEADLHSLCTLVEWSCRCSSFYCTSAGFELAQSERT